MTDKQKLQHLFDAALKAPAEPAGTQPQRAFPTPSFESIPVPAAPAQQAPVQPVFVMPPANVMPVDTAAPVQTGAPTMAAVLDDAASTELAALLDEQHKRKTRKRRMEALVTALILFGLTGGGSAWFVQDPGRVQAFKEAMRDIRSVGDVKSLVAKYQKALDRVAARGKQIDQASAAMGVKKSAADDKDPFMEEEMKKMMGGKGKTVGARNRALVENFGHMAKENGGLVEAKASLKEGESFDWNR